ncbi:hypothetical protein HDV57DRAFT_488338 [Trichoderma longibrachiatum]
MRPEYSSEGFYNQLHEIEIAFLVTHGDNDILIPTSNSWITYDKLTNTDSNLHLFPDVARGL